MRSVSVTAVAMAVFVSAMLLPVCLSSDAAAAGVAVYGQVNTGTGGTVTGLEGVHVYLRNTAGTETVETTAANGSFGFDDVDAGTYTLRFEKIGYAVDMFVCDGVPSYGNTLSLTVGTDPIDIHVLMNEAFGMIEGAVKRNGAKAVGVTVEARDADSRDLVMTMRTDDDGMFSFRLPVGGHYIISVNHMYLEADSVSVTVPAGPLVLPDILLVPKKGTTYLFELDLTHSLMVVGGIAGLFLFIFIVLYRIHIERNPERSKIYSDPGKKKDQN